jgi:hypothetical protein
LDDLVPVLLVLWRELVRDPDVPLVSKAHLPEVLPNGRICAVKSSSKLSCSQIRIGIHEIMENITKIEARPSRFWFGPCIFLARFSQSVESPDDVKRDRLFTVSGMNTLGRFSRCQS